MYAFIHIPKTAGTTLRYLFRRSFGADHCDVKCPKHCSKNTPWLRANHLRLVKILYPNLTGVSGHRVCCFSDLDIALPNVNYFTFLRDPYKRFISDFHHCYRGRIDQCTVDNFTKFAQRKEKRNAQTHWVCGSDDFQLAKKMLNEKVGFVGITESFDESLILLKAWLNEEKFTINYEVRNRAHAEAPLPYLTDPHLRAIIEEANQADIELYNYAKNEIFPQQVEKYGALFEKDLATFKDQQVDFKDVEETLWARIKRNWFYKPMLHLPKV